MKALGILTLALVLINSACIPQDSVRGSEDSTNVDFREIIPDELICDPFYMDDGIVGTSTYGLSGSLFYLTDDQPRYESIYEYMEHGTEVTNRTLYLNRLNVPTRAFDRGFVTEGGQTITTPNGDTLYEYFAMRLRSQLVLNAANLPGSYQLAVLSDDGVLLSIDTGDGLIPLIENDGFHPTRMACTTQALYMDSTTRIPIQLDYFQGPRYHISLILMWRPFPTNPADIVDPLCGHTSNEDFFDSTQVPSVPMTAYQELLSRGWKPLETSNYLLQEGVNPCAAL